MNSLWQVWVWYKWRPVTRPLTQIWRVSRRKPWGQSRPPCAAQRWMGRWCIPLRAVATASWPPLGWWRAPSARWRRAWGKSHAWGGSQTCQPSGTEEEKHVHTILNQQILLSDLLNLTSASEKHFKNSKNLQTYLTWHLGKTNRQRMNRNSWYEGWSTKWREQCGTITVEDTSLSCTGNLPRDQRPGPKFPDWLVCVQAQWCKILCTTAIQFYFINGLWTDTFEKLQQHLILLFRQQETSSYYYYIYNIHFLNRFLCFTELCFNSLVSLGSRFVSRM